MKQCKDTIAQLSIDIDHLKTEINNFNATPDCKAPAQNEIKLILQNHERVTKTRITKKLNNLYMGNIKIKENSKAYTNLSKYEPTKDQEEFLNLGLNYHIQPKYSKLDKSTELEILYEDLLKLEKEQKVTIHPNLPDQLRNEATKHRNLKYNSHLTPRLKQAAKELFENPQIVIKKADKSSSYVILDKNEYLDKINNLVSDQNKFKLVRKDPTEKLKTKANKLITSVNAAQNNIKLEKVIGNFNPGYLYGTIKTHKPGNKIRPIISQITSPTYKLAKKLHQIILPYIPSKYLLKSSNDFIDLLNTNKYNGHVASLDVESLFTNVPIDDTINIILNLTYCNNSILSPKISRNLLKQLQIAIYNTQWQSIPTNRRCGNG